MTYDTAEKLLDALIQGARLTATELDQVVRRIGEGQHLDYKDGSITHRGKRKEGRLTIRRCVSAFANADGGVLIIGVSDKSRRISPCLAPHKQSLVDWVADLLRDMTPLLTPPPRIQTVKHSKGLVLIIATSRSPNLVSVVEAGRAAYYLRFHDSTVEIPEFLLSDLFLGRRERPLIALEVRAGFPRRLRDSQFQDLSFFCSVSNISLVTARQVQLGVVSWTMGAPGRDPSDYLLGYLDIDQPPDDQWSLKHTFAVPGNGSEGQDIAVARLSAFSRNRRAIRADFFRFPSAASFEVSACAYVLSEGSPPTWWEVRFSLGPSVEAGGLEVSGLEIERVGGRRPVISVCCSPTD